MPVDHLNGKLAPSSVVCHNQPDTDVSGTSFYYGYRYRNKPDTSRYAIREKSRNLSVNPYTVGEEASKQAFSDAVAQAQHVLSNPTTYPGVTSAFRSQHRYIRRYNYVIATLILTGGDIPPEWY